MNVNNQPAVLGTFLVFSLVLGGVVSGADNKTEIVLQQGSNEYQGCLEVWKSEKKKAIDKQVFSGNMRFDLASIPPKSRIYEAEFSLYVLNISPECIAFEMPLYQWAVRRNTSDDMPSEPAYGVHFASAHPSSFRGGMRIPGVPEGKVEKEKQWVHWNMTEMVQYWIDHPDQNHGWIIVGNDGRKNEFRHRVDLYQDRLKEFYGTRWNPMASGTRRCGSVAFASSLHEPETPPAMPEVGGEERPAAASFRPKLRVVYGPVPPEPQGAIKKVVLQQGADGYSGCVDTEIDEDRPGPLGREQFFIVHRVPDGTWIGKFQRPLIRFDLTAIKKEATVVKAELKLYCLGGERGDKRGVKTLAEAANLPQEPAMYNKTPVWAARMITEWDETATLQAPKPKQQWKIPKLGAGSDFYGPPSWLFRDYMIIPGLAKALIEDYGQWYAWDVTEFAREWVCEPEKNNGMLLLMSGLCMFHKHLEDLTEEDMSRLFAPPDKDGPRNVHERMWLLNRILWKKPSFENLEQQDYVRFATANGPPETRPILTVTYHD